MALDVVDNLIASQRLSISTISKHNSGLASKNPEALVELGTKKCCAFAKSLFQNAALKVNESLQANNSAQEIACLVELARLGWPLLRIGQKWFVNYGYEALLNLPHNNESIAGIVFTDHQPKLTFSSIQPVKLKITLDNDKCFCFADQVPITNNYLHDALQRARLQTLDRALLDLIRSSYSENTIADQNLSSILDIHFNSRSCRFELVDNKDVIMIDLQATALGAQLYRSFVDSRAKFVNLSII